ncbi:MAG: acyltransferase family protein, partial [Acidovorax sp.]|nr:acyltransferase family protein [Acidovorax sp.]
AAGAGFVSNLALWGEAGYFDASADTKPLLHLWSLGVEEQFYIILPLLLWAAWRLKIKSPIIIGMVAIASFWINIHTIRKDASASFYAPYTRFWELMAGSLLAAMHARLNEYRTKNLGNALSVFGILLLAYGCFRIHGGIPFPGKWALVPVLGATSIIAAGPESWINKHVLSNRALVWIGLISFPVYLWHWPLLTYARILSSGSPTTGLRIAVVMLSFLLGWITFRWIERPLRFGPRDKMKVAWLSAGMIMVAVMGWSTYRNEGFAWRQVNQINAENREPPAAYQQQSEEIHLKNECGISDARLKEHFSHCVMDERGPTKYALMGDSKAGAMFAGLVRTSTERGRWMFIGGFHPKYGAPLPLLEKNLHESRFINLVAIDAIAKNEEIETAVLVVAVRNLFDLSPYADGTVNTYDPGYLRRMAGTAYKESTLDGMDRAVKMLADAGKKVVVVLDNPPFPNSQDCIGRKSSLVILNEYLAAPNSACQVSLVELNSLIEPYFQ